MSLQEMKDMYLAKYPQGSWRNRTVESFFKDINIELSLEDHRKLLAEIQHEQHLNQQRSNASLQGHKKYSKFDGPFKKK